VLSSTTAGLRPIEGKAVSGLLRVHPKTIYEWAKAGRLPAVTINSRIRFEQAETDRFIAARQPKYLDPRPLLQRLGYSPETCDRFLLKGGRSALRKSSGRRRLGFGTVYVRKTKTGES